MPRKTPGERGKTWELKTSPDLFSPILKAKHETASSEIKRAYYEIDSLYQQAAKILDREGVPANVRLLYRSYMEELYKVKQRFTGQTLTNRVGAIYSNYFRMGGNYHILREIAEMMGLRVPLVGLDYCILG